MNNVYLYLTKPEWAEAWIQGGAIPINKASAYRSMSRNGVYTLDECESIHGHGIDGDALDHLRSIIVGPGELRSRKVIFPGGKVKSNVHVVREEWDGYILSFSDVKSRTIMHQLGKSVCVEISDVIKLVEVISKQINCKGTLKKCEYTESIERGIFTKSYLDQWQSEVRVYWDLKEKIPNVIIPSGMASIVHFTD